MLNNAKGYVGKTINLYLKDGSVMACMKLIRISNKQLWCKASEHSRTQTFHIKNISRIEEVTIFERYFK
jgi:hypothetical protein